LERFSLGLNGATALERLERFERLFLKAEMALPARVRKSIEATEACWYDTQN
jgi:hypothetical protein